MAVVTLFAPGVERRRRFCALAKDEQLAAEDVENLARRMVRAEREGWQGWLKRDAHDALSDALKRLDVARERLRALQEGA